MASSNGDSSFSDLDELFEKSSTGVLLIDGETHRILHVNSWLTDELGYSADELTTRSLDELIAPECEATSDELLRIPSDQSTTRHLCLNHQDHSPVSFRATVSIPSDSQRLFILQPDQATFTQQAIQTDEPFEERFLNSSLMDFNFHRDLIRETLDEIYVFDVETSRVVDVNETALDRLGYVRGEMIGTPIWEFVDGFADREQWREQIKKYRKGHPGVVQGHHVRKDGSRYPVEVNSTLLEQDGEEYLVSVARDISKRREQERETERLFNTVNEIITVHDPDTHELVDINRTAEELIGYSKDELLEMGVEGYSVKEEGFTQEAVKEALLDFLESPEDFEPIEWACWTRDGKKLWFEVNPAVMKWKGKERILTISREITQRRANRNKLQFRESLLKAQQEAADEGILVVDEERNILSYNDQFQEIWDIPDGVLQERSDESAIEYVLDKLENPDEFRETVEELYDQRDEELSDVIHLTDGTILDRYTSPVQDEENFYGRVWYFRDITEEREVQEQLEKSLKEKETLLEEIHHRVKNNIQIIMSLLKMQMKNQGSEELKEAFRDSLNRLETMALIHEKLYQSEHLSDVDFPKYIRELCDRLVRGYAQGEAVELDVEVDDIQLDLETSISCGLIVNELVSNAFEHGLSENEGRIVVDVNRTDDGFVLAVSDNGQGLPGKFEPEQTDSIGMKIVHSLVEYDLEGDIEFNDTTGGLTVRIHVPEQAIGV